jgi:TM2 domain-containing membrane protein YozV
MGPADDELYGALYSKYIDGTISLSGFERMKSYLADSSYAAMPGDSQIWKETGNIFFRLKNYPVALKCYESAVEIENNNTAALHNIGVTYRAMGRTGDAEKIFAYLKENAPVNESVKTADTPNLPPPGYPEIPIMPPTVPGDNRSFLSSCNPPETRKMKSPPIAAILSFFFGGLGQVYNGRLGKGLAIFFGIMFGTLLVVPGLILWIYSIYDAHKTSKRMNEGAIPYREANGRDYVIYFAVMAGFIVLVVGLVVFVVMPVIFPAGHGMPAADPAQFTNPGFETGTFSGWLAGNTTSILGDRAHSGKYYAHFDMSGTQATNYMVHPLDLTGKSAITFWGYGEGNNWPFYVYVDKELVAEPHAVPDTWTQYTVPISGYSSFHSVIVAWNGGPGLYGADVDDFSGR